MSSSRCSSAAASDHLQTPDPFSFFPVPPTKTSSKETIDEQANPDHRGADPGQHRGLRGGSEVRAVGLQPADGLPAVRDRLPESQSRHQCQDHAIGLGRLLDRDLDRFHLGHRARRVHQPPGQVSRVRAQRPAAGPEPADRARQGQD